MCTVQHHSKLHKDFPVSESLLTEHQNINNHQKRFEPPQPLKSGTPSRKYAHTQGTCASYGTNLYPNYLMSNVV